MRFHSLRAIRVCQCAYGHHVGIPIMMKVEDAANGAVFVEAQDTITVAGDWNTLTFDYSNPTNGTLNLANTYDKASMFFDFNMCGSE